MLDKTQEKAILKDCRVAIQDVDILKRTNKQGTWCKRSPLVKKRPKKAVLRQMPQMLKSTFLRAM